MYPSRFCAGTVRSGSEHVFVLAKRPVPPVPHVRRSGRPPSPNRTCRVELRPCRYHGLAEFALYSQRWRCKRCVGEAVTRRKQRVKRVLVEEAGGCCAVCGYGRCVINLVFHHIDPDQKSFGLSSATSKALATLREEMRKCILFCANCHGEIEAGLIESPRPRRDEINATC
jgi:hypothetical protein